MASRTNPFTVHFHDTVQINILRHNNGSRVEDPPSPPYWNIPLAELHQNVPPGSSEGSETRIFHQVFLKAKPKSRGFFQIFVAHFQLALGIALNFVGGKNFTWLSYIIFWGPSFLIVSGFVAVAAQNRPSIKLVKAATILESGSFIISLFGLTLCCVDVFRIYPCGFSCPFGNMGTLAIISVLLMTNLVQISMSSYIVVFGFRSLRSYSEDLPRINPSQNLGFVFPDPPPYSEIATIIPQSPAFSSPREFPQSPTFPEPPPFSQSSAYPPPPPFSQLSSFPPPPLFSESSSFPPPFFESSSSQPQFSQSSSFPPPPPFSHSPALSLPSDVFPPADNSQPPPYSE